MHHPNHVVALEEVRFVNAEPAATAARLSLLAGRPFAPDAAGGFALTLPRGRLHVLPGDPGIPPRMTGIRLRTDDGNAAITTLLHDDGIAHEARPEGLLVRTGGAELLFAG